MNKTIGRYQVSKRNSSIELLRIFAASAVIVLHFNFLPSGGGAIDNVYGITRETLYILEALCCCAVNVFILISGYFNVNSYNINFSRLFKLGIQTSLFSFIWYVIVNLKSGVVFHVKSALGALLPVNYYVILYITVMIIAPFINILVNKLTDKGLIILGATVFLLFSVYPTMIDILEELTNHSYSGLSSIGTSGSGGGYTIVNFTLVYILGALLRKLDISNRINKKYVCIGIIMSIIIIYLWRKTLTGTAYNYCNPFVIIEAVFVLIFFLQIEFENRLINQVSSASFTCYLIQGYLLQKINFSEIGKLSFVRVVLSLLATIVAIYLCSIIITMIWNLVAGHIFKITVDKIERFKIG